MDRDDYWIYSPQFSKVLGLVINELFKIKIQFHSLSGPVSLEKTICVIDNHANRWILSIQKREREPEKLRISMRLPRTKTTMCACDLVHEKEVHSGTPALCVDSTSSWYS